MKYKKLISAGRRLLSVTLCAVLAFGLLCGSALAAGRLVIADDPLVGGDGVTQTISEKIETDGGIGADIRSNNDPVTVTLTGGITVQETTEETATGVRATAVSGGTVGLTLSGDVEAKSKSIAYGVHLETPQNEELSVCYYENSDGQTVPLMMSLYIAFPTAVRDGENDVSSVYAVGDDANPLAFFARTEDGDWDLLLTGYDATVTGWSKTPVSEQTVKDFSGYITGEGTLRQAGPITVTICTPDGGEDGTELTLEIASEPGRAVLYDVFGNYFLPVRSEEDVLRKPTKDNTEGFSPYLMYGEPSLDASVSGTVSAQGAKACAVNALPSRGGIDISLSDVALVSSGETWAWGVNAKPLKALTLTGSNVKITATGADDVPSSSVLGIMVSVASNTTNVELTGSNSISASATALPGVGEYSGGIVAYASGATLGNATAGVCNVRYEGSISASGIGMVGVEALAAMGGTTNVTILGDVTLTDSDSDGVYASADKRLPLYTPKSELYLCGSIALTGATGEAAGVSANGSVVIVDGDVNVAGTDGVMGVYADAGMNQLKTQGATVLVTGTVTAPTAVFIPPDDDTITNNSRVYVWNYAGELDGKTENVGYVVKLEDGLTATPESDSLFSVEKEGKTYYGADRGDTVKITTESDVRVVSAKGVQLPVTPMDGGWTFVMPEDCGVTVSRQAYVPVIEPEPTADPEPDTVSLPAKSVEAAAAAGESLNVETENGTVRLSADTVRKLAQTGKDVKVSVRENGDSTMTVDVTVDGASVDAIVLVALPAPKAGHVLVIVNEDGTEATVKKSLVEDGMVYAKVSAGATVRVVENEVSFDDVKPDDWFTGDVEFVTSHGLFEGTGKGFEPTMPMTRAMLATVLYRLEDAAATDTSAFADVPDGTWYTDPAIWTGSNGIIQGTGKGFEPERNVTREQLATILFRYANTIGLDTSGRAPLSDFADCDLTAPWAKDAMEWAVSAGLIRGFDNGTLNPGGEATRAQVAAIFQHLVKLIVK